MDELKNKPIKNILKEARNLYKERKYPEALIYYNYFFDHSLDNDPSSFYGVRLSYCLNEWAMLGEKYPPALEELEYKKNQALLLFEKTGKNIHFHEFKSICRYLNRKEEAVSKFIEYHKNNSELAKQSLDLIWDSLIEKQMWEICAQYPENLDSIYKKSFSQLDALIDSEYLNDFFKIFVKKIKELLLVLHNTNREDDAILLEKRLTEDLNNRNYGYVIKLIITKGH